MSKENTVVITSAVRTAIGSLGGSLKNVPAYKLGSTVISNAIKKQLSTQEIEEIAIKEGMLSLKAYAVKLIEKKLTTVSELSKICNDDHN